MVKFNIIVLSLYIYINFVKNISHMFMILYLIVLNIIKKLDFNFLNNKN